MTRTVVSFALVGLASVACHDSTPTDPAPSTVQEKPSSPVPPPVPAPPTPTPRPATTEYIYVAAADGSGSTKLTLGSWASWSPDGRRVLFHRGPTWAAPLFPGVIFVIDADGTHETRLADGRWPSWSPDGNRIAFVDELGVEVMDADGSNKRLVLRRYFRNDTYQPSDMGPAKPVWSPDGKRIAFEHLGDGDMMPAQVFVMNADGTNPHTVTTDPRGWSFAESDPAWSPDGATLAHWSYWYGLSITDAGGGQPRTVYADFPSVSYGAKPAWSRDGKTLAFNVWRSKTNEGRSVYLLDLTGGPLRMVVANGYDLAYSPDQKRIAYTSTRNDST